MGDLPLHLRWGEDKKGSSSWPLGAPQAGETADAGEAGSTGKNGRNGWRRGARACCGWAGSSRTEMSGAQSNSVDPETPSAPPFIAVHLIIVVFPCIVNHNLFLHLSVATIGGRKCNGNLC